MGNTTCCKTQPHTESKDEILSLKDLNDSNFLKTKSKGNDYKVVTPENSSEIQQNTHFDRNCQETTSAIAPHAEHEDLASSIIKVQKCVRGNQSRHLFNSTIKPSLYQSQMEVISKQSLIFTNLKEAEDKVTTQPYDANGWKAFYCPQTDFFNFNYGEVKEQQVMVIPPSKDSEDKEVSYYTGQVNNKNERHGYGILSNSKVKYEGYWRNNEFTGWGREITVNGNVLEGKFINGKLSGKGQLLNNKKEVFVGDFENGKKKGKGKETTEQYIYEGEYSNNSMNGQGTITFVNEKNQYTGDFFNNELTGKGTYAWESGEKYEGTLLKGNYHGRGVFTWPDGQVYEGDYINGIKEGYGKTIYPNGNIYEGPYVSGNPHGIGKYTKKGKTVNVEFNNGSFVKIIN